MWLFFLALQEPPKAEATAKLSPRVAAPLCVPTSWEQEGPWPHPHPDPPPAFRFGILFWILATLTGCSVIVVFLCASLMTYDVGYLFKLSMPPVFFLR